MKIKLSEYNLWLICFGVIATALLIAVIIGGVQAIEESGKQDFGQLDQRAKGCSIAGPDGQPLVLNSGHLTIPKGTFITGECFPAVSAKTL